MNREDFKAIAGTRLVEAKVLLAAEKPDDAYYLAGYAVEAALKACIAKATREHDFPDKSRTNQAWTHDLSQLLRVAELTSDFNTHMAADPAFGVNWNVIKDWSEDARYDRTKNMQTARDFVDAIESEPSGVLSWLKRHW